MPHDVQWYCPAPLWPERLQNGTGNRLQRPELLQFKQDDFMAELQTTLEDTPNALDEKRADGEKYLGRNGTPESVEGPIPLYQPAHQRYYLVTASLVCRERGLPDRAVDTANEEKVAFVLRRLVSDASGSVDVDGEPHAEYRWVKTLAKENGSSGGSGQNGSGQNGVATAGGKTGEWHRAGNPLDVPDQEERLSMFPQSYAPQTPVEQMKGKRRLWAGLVPVAKRETYETAPIRQTNGDGSSPPVPNDRNVDSKYALDDPRKTKFETRIIQAFKGIRDQLKESPSSVSAADVRDPLLFAWLDLWQFLEEHLPNVATKIRGNESARAADFEKRGTQKVDLINELDKDLEGPEIGALGKTASAILHTVAEKAERIESGNLGDVLAIDELPSIERLTAVLDDVLEPNKKEKSLDEKPPDLQKTVYAALGSPTGDLPESPQPPSTEPIDGGRYVVRCVYERPNCPEPLRMEVSEPSRAFRLASFFDAQAPPRDINITLPGASVQDFRDSSQSVTMRFGEELRKQAQRVQDLSIKAVDNGNVGSAPKVNIGMICSLSIPIITICALILLLVIVLALNVVFWWLPFFKICFPLPSSNS